MPHLLIQRRVDTREAETVRCLYVAYLDASVTVYLGSDRPIVPADSEVRR